MKWNISFGDEMKQEHRKLHWQQRMYHVSKCRQTECMCMHITKTYVLIDSMTMPTQNSTLEQHQLPNEIFSLMFVYMCNATGCQLSSFSLLLNGMPKKATKKHVNLKIRFKWNAIWDKRTRKNHIIFLQLVWFFARDFGFYYTAYTLNSSSSPF